MRCCAIVLILFCFAVSAFADLFVCYDFRSERYVVQWLDPRREATP